MRIERLIYSVLILGASTLAIVNWRRVALFKADNEELRSQVEMLVAEAENSGRLMEVTKENAQKVRSQMKELLQLVICPTNPIRSRLNQNQKFSIILSLKCLAFIPHALMKLLITDWN